MIKGRENHSRRQNGGRHNRIGAKNHRWNIKKADSRQDRTICSVLFERNVNMDIDACNIIIQNPDMR